MVQTVLFITVYTGVGLNTDIRKGLYDRFRSLPIWQPAPLFGALAGFVNLGTMPAWLQAAVGRNPVTYRASASRKLMHGEDASADIVAVFAVAALIVAVAAPVSMRLYRKER